MVREIGRRRSPGSGTAGPAGVTPKPPRQKRSRETLARIVDAGRAILLERGADGLTVQEVVAQARTSVGSFYQRFSGRDELLSHLERMVASDAAERFEQALTARIRPGLSLTATIDAVLVSMHDQRTAAVDLASFKELEHARADAVVRILMGNRSEMRHSDPGLAIRVAYAAASGALREPPAGVESHVLLPELGRFWSAYLASGSTTMSAEGVVDFFEVWG